MSKPFELFVITAIILAFATFARQNFEQEHAWENVMIACIVFACLFAGWRLFIP